MALINPNATASGLLDSNGN